jgi:hypothetical protein
LEVSLEASGIENAISLSISFDSSQWEFVDLRPGSDAPDATLIFKASADGSLAIAMALPPGQSLKSGAQTLINVTFRRRQYSTQRFPVIRLATDSPIKSEIVDVEGNSLSGRWIVVAPQARNR